MSNPIAILIPLINPNEKEARLTDIYVQDGMLVKKGDLVASIESTKAALDIHAEVDGFIKGIRRSSGDMVLAGDVLCYLVENLSDSIPQEVEKITKTESQPDSVDGLRITMPARRLAEAEGIDLAVLPRSQLITEAVIRKLIGKTGLDFSQPIHDRHLVIFGGGGHGKSILELVRSEGKWDILGFIDDGIASGELIFDIPVLGGASMLPALHEKGLKYIVNAVGGIGNLDSRIRVFERIRAAGLICPAVLHPRAVYEQSSEIDDGSQVFSLAYIGSSTKIGFGCIINTGAIISHDCQIGEFSNISPGAILAGGVQLEARVMIGMGVTINLNVKVRENVRIGNGATIKSDVPAGTVVKAGSIWPG